MKNLKLQIINERRAFRKAAKDEAKCNEEIDLNFEENGPFKDYAGSAKSQTSQKTICIKCGLDKNNRT